MRLEIITPIRGRKQMQAWEIFIGILRRFRNNNPDKGTETMGELDFLFLIIMFRNNNPDKGTETLYRVI